jgi:hypothetical protein
LSPLELRMNEIIQHVATSGFFYLIYHLWDLSMSFCKAVRCTFLLLGSTPLMSYTTIVFLLPLWRFRLFLIGTIMDILSFVCLLCFELRALHLLSRHSTTWATPPALFALVILEIGCYFFA